MTTENKSIQKFWDDRYSSDEYCYGKEPNSFLLEHYFRLKKGGNILCLSEGEGRNAIFLASKGFNVTAVDLSSKGKEKALKFAKEHKLHITYDIADLKDYNLGEFKWDAIISISAHLPSTIRVPLHLSIKKGLTNNGIFLLEGYNINQIDLKSGGPKDKDMLFSKAQLEHDFNGFSIELSRDIIRNFSEGKFHKGDASVTQFIAKKTNY
ncbi:class I SAM-dependent methyltransferase [Halobacteriovorax sp. JY17]|uniref:class I SAM-dependent methyltransferase n=1 Tax=Halobacteriovorax sp. JY17 TaxID=2014617 RepID=UPI000C4554FE|nr:class I SAM-dependent methyltransferase [Halobacteriovorax sp. JY17]PIK16411.1 MAG: SAM-dependent methyltransferase [Halobacteriovorax sp. JY17]